MRSDVEEYRNQLFRAAPGLSDFVACALQDAQLTENDEACTEEREPRDSGTIYTMPGEVFEQFRTLYLAFRRECGEHIATLQALEPGADGLEWLKRPERLTDEGLGSTLWLAVCGSGVTFTDDGSHESLEALSEWARKNYTESLYFGDDGRVYLC